MRRLGGLSLAPFAPFALGAFAIMGALVQQWSKDRLLLALCFYSAATALVRGSGLAESLYRSWDLAFFMHIPISDQAFFQRMWRRFLRSSVGVFVISFATFAIVAWESTVILKWWLILAAAIWQWLVVLNAATASQLLVPSWKKGPFILALYFLVPAVIFVPSAWVNQFMWLALCLPTSWVPELFGRIALYRQDIPVGWFAGGVFLLLPLPVIVGRLRDLYDQHGPAYPIVSVSAMEETEGEPIHAGLSNEQMIADEDGASNAKQYQAAAALDWSNSGWIEQIVSRWMTERQRSICEFLCGGELDLWTKRWITALKFAGVGAVLMFVPLMPEWIAIWIGVAAALISLPLLGGYWKGMQLCNVAGKSSPVYAGTPISYTDISQVLAKVNLLRFVAGAPLVMGYAMLLGFRQHAAFLSVSALLLLAAILVHPFMVVGQHSRGTNDSRVLNPHSLLAFSVIIVCGIGCAALAATLFFAASPSDRNALLSSFAAAGIAVFSFSGWLVHRWLYDHGRIDLMRSPDQ